MYSNKTTNQLGDGSPHIDANIFGITSGESLGGVDNGTAINVGNTSLGGMTTIGGNSYHGSAPSVTMQINYKNYCVCKSFNY